MNPTNSGKTTSEFIATIAVLVSSLAVTGGIISVDQQDAFTQLIVSVLVGLGALVTIGGVALTYIKGRNELKMKMLENTSTVGQIAE